MPLFYWAALRGFALLILGVALLFKGYLMTDKKQPTPLIGVDTTFHDNADGVFRKHNQHIPDSFMQDLSDMRHNSATQREDEFMKVASIPTVIVEKWLREGFDIMGDRNITPADVVRKLKAEGLDDFLATGKRV